MTITTPKARPILFSAPMVRALLDGRKTQTRRIAKHPLLDDVPNPLDVVHENLRHAAPYLDSYCGGAKTSENPRGMTEWWCWWTRDDRPCHQFKCPYGKPGDLLWARETWQALSFGDYQPTKHHVADVRFAATDALGSTDKDVRGYSWRPAIHMPRWASRITLELTGVKIERLNDISKQDVIAEGITERDGAPIEDAVCGWHEPYAALWEKLNGPGSWEDNPWVWALEFYVHSVNVDELVARLSGVDTAARRDELHVAQT